MFYIRTVISFIKDKEYRNLLLTTAIVLGFGTVTYHFLEGWDWIDSVYFSVITLSTIGYGDFSPQTPEGKLFTIFYILIGIGIILSFINAVYDHYTNVRQDENKK
ncbi:MAG: potassium channel family protein [Bacteroidia bacterium]|nr:potassium channel family protein [Bacteroidia bacterium]NNJ55793.1 two pore domain potassium channel family protein [Bacteroidia bacterium]